MRHRWDFTEKIEDKLALSAALAAACSLSVCEVLDRLEPRISARAEKMQRAVEAAAQTGRAHRLAGVRPYCPLDADGDDSRLMAASGETEPTTHANAGYRLALAGAYTAQAAYLVAAPLFIAALAGLSHHETARAGNTFGIAGMAVALAATVALAVHGHISGAGLATLAQFAGAWYAAGAHPLRRYLEDLNDEDASTGDVVNAVSERRVFAVPLPAGRVDGLAEESDGSRRKASELDAAVSGDRTLITVMEASARGVPQHRFPSFVTVAQQLWDGDPLEVWQAARRLRDAGRSRDWVLDRLARTWDAYEGDDERYVATLKQL